MFLVDTDAVENGLKQVSEITPDALEVMPGIVPEMVANLVQRTNIPIITGGLVQHRHHITQALQSGAIAVSTGNPTLWKTVQKEGLHD